MDEYRQLFLVMSGNKALAAAFAAGLIDGFRDGVDGVDEVLIGVLRSIDRGSPHEVAVGHDILSYVLQGVEGYSPRGRLLLRGTFDVMQDCMPEIAADGHFYRAVAVCEAGGAGAIAPPSPLP